MRCMHPAAVSIRGDDSMAHSYMGEASAAILGMGETAQAVADM